MTAVEVPDTTSDLEAAAAAISAADTVVATAVARLAEPGRLDTDQVLAYDVAHAAAAVATGKAMLPYAHKGKVESALAVAFIADAVADLAGKLFGREAQWGVAPDALDSTRAFVAAYRDPSFLASLAEEPGPRHLDDDFELVQDT